MSIVRILSKIFLVLLLFGGLLLLAKNAQTIRGTIARQFGIQQKQVAGAKTSLEKEVKSNLVEYAEDAKEKTLQMKISDLIKPIMRAKKIGEDVMKVKEEVVKQIESFTK